MRALIATSACEGLGLLSLPFRLCSFLFDTLVFFLSLIVRVCSIVENLAVHRRDVRRQSLPVVFQVLQTNLQSSAFVVSLQYFFLCLCNSYLANLILLLQIDNELILSLDDSLVLFKHFLSLFCFPLVIGFHVGTDVVEGVQLLVQPRDLVVLDYDQLIEFIDFFHRVPLLALVSLEHRE